MSGSKNNNESTNMSKRFVIQQWSDVVGWYDVSEVVEVATTADAMLARFRQDLPNKMFRIATA